MFNAISNQCYSIYLRLKSVYDSEPVQNVAGATYFTFGIYAAYHLVTTQFLKDRNIRPIEAPTWKKTTLKVIDIVGDISYLLSSLRSRPALFLWRWAASKILAPSHFERLMGQASQLASSRYSFAASIIIILMGIPSTLKTTYLCYHWAKSFKH